MKTTMYFSECEHDGDLDNYVSDIINCGGKIISSQINHDEETARVEIEYEPGFVEKFKKTDSIDFSNWSN